MFFFVILVSTKKFRLVQLEAKPNQNQNTRFTKFLEADRFLFLKIIFLKKTEKIKPIRKTERPP